MAPGRCDQSGELAGLLNVENSVPGNKNGRGDQVCTYYKGKCRQNCNAGKGHFCPLTDWYPYRRPLGVSALKSQTDSTKSSQPNTHSDHPQS